MPGDLSKYFSRWELECKCGCGLMNIDPELLGLLDRLREKLDRPLSISSGSRCPAHNLHEGGKKNSAHLTGLAADLKVNGSRERFEILRALSSCGVTRIGIAKTFIHVDIDASKPQEVVWLY
jgi:uncharacterized protein YcbK (DUF882 family)